MLDRRALCASFPKWLSVFRLRPILLSSMVFLWWLPASAATVAIVRPASPSPVATETLSRLHGEFLSVGLEVRIANGPADRGQGGLDARSWLEALAAERGVSAVVAILGDVTPVAVDVWVVDKTPGRFSVTRVAVEPGTENVAERLAIRSLEVLRSSFLEIELAARRRGFAPITTPLAVALSQGEGSPPAGQRERLGLEVGAAALTSLDGIGTALMPIVRVGWAARPWLVLQAALAGLGSRPTVATVAGSARIAQQFGLLGGRLRLHEDSWVRPFLALSAGLLRTAVQGQADSPSQGHSAAPWSFLVDGSLGAGLRLHGRYHLTLAAHVQLATPYVAVHFMDSVVASSGRPNLMLTLTVGAWL
jgi:hypothetical protein